MTSKNHASTVTKVGVNVHSSMVRAPAMSVAPRIGQNIRIIFQYAGLCALMTLSCALK